MKDISIKKRLLIAFTLIALFVAILAGYSNYGVSKSAAGFTNYREMAKDSVLAGSFKTNTKTNACPNGKNNIRRFKSISRKFF